MRKQLHKLFDWFSSQPASYFNINESKTVSQFNWFARYDVSHDKTLVNKPKQ